MKTSKTRLMATANLWVVPLLLLVSCGYPARQSSTMLDPSDNTEPSTSPLPTAARSLAPTVPLEHTVPSPANIAAAAKQRQLGLELRSGGQLTEAISAFQQGVELDPTNPNGHVILGWTLHLAGQPDAAIAALKAALARDADFVPALNALGIVYLVDGQLEAAIDTHLQAIDRQADNEIAFYNLSLAYQRLEQSDLAVMHARRATELEPANPHPWVALAIALRSQGAREAAGRAYARAIQLDSRYGESSFLGHLSQAGFSSAQIQQSDLVRQGL